MKKNNVVYNIHRHAACVTLVHIAVPWFRYKGTTVYGGVNTFLNMDCAAIGNE